MYSCPAGQTVFGASCLSGTVMQAIVTGYKCAAGQMLLGSACVWTSQSASTITTAAVASCPSGGTYEGSAGCHFAGYNAGIYMSYYYAPTWVCPLGTNLSGSSCQQSTTTSVNTTTGATPVYTCPGGEVLNTSSTSGVCQPAVKQAVASVSYTCPSGYQLSGQTCRQGTGTTADTSGMAADRQLDFIYGPEHQRVRQIVTLSANAPSNMHSGTTWYLHGDNNDLFYEKEIRADGTTEHKHYLSAGGLTFAIQTIREGALNGKPAKTLNYLHHDHLGSTSAVTDEAGAVIERMAYDPWGKRRYANGVADTSDSIVPSSTERGFTMHEHLDELGIIHMNGRIYDPYTGRFMSADPFIQDAGNLQSYNRYAYVMNNPLNMTDPSGYWSLRKLFRTVVAIAVAYYTGQWAEWNLMSVQGITSAQVGFAAGAAGGFAGAMVASGGNLKAGLQGALSGGLFGAAGTFGNPTDNIRYAAHAVAGCVSAVAGGGKCGQGLTAAVFGKFTTNALEGSEWIKGDLAKGVATTIAGGVGSVIAGGKFDNGAATAAMGYLFNYCMHSTTGCFIQKGMNALKIFGGSAGFAVGVATCGVTFGLGCAAAVESGNQVIEGATYFANAGAEEGFKPSKSILQSVFGESAGTHINTGAEVLTALQNAGSPVALKGFSLFRPDMSTRIEQMGTFQLGVTTGSTAGKLLSDPYYKDQLK